MPLVVLLVFAVMIPSAYVLAPQSPAGSMALFFAVAIGFQCTGRLKLGEDGFSVSWLRRFKRFVPYAEVSAVSHEFRWTQPNHRVVVVLQSHRVVDIPVWSSSAAEEIARALRDAVEASRRPRVKPADIVSVSELTALQRGDRSSEEWVAHLRRIGDSAAPRSSSPPRDVLWTIAQHPDAPPRARIAAAVALTGASATEADRVRIAELASDFAVSPTRDVTDLTLEDEAVLAKVVVALERATRQQKE